MFAYGVSVVFWDSWTWVDLVSPKGLSLGTLWAQHNESRTFFPNLVADVLIHLTNWNDVALMLVSATFLIGILAVIVRALWPEITRAPLVWLPVPFLVLTLAQNQNTLWSFQMAWPLTFFFVVGALAVLVTGELTATRVFVAIALGALASFSLLQGLLVWPVGILMLSGRPSRRWLVQWVPAAAVCTTVYLVGFNFSESSSAPTAYVLHHIGPVLRGILLSVGSIVVADRGSGFTSPPYQSVTEACGFVLLVAGGVVLVSWLRSGCPLGPRGFSAGLVATTFLFELLLVPGRIAVLPIAGTASRYDTFSWPLLLGVYGYSAIALRGRSIPRVRVVHWVLVGAVAVEVVVGSVTGISQGQMTRTVRLTAVDVLANWRIAQPDLDSPYLLPPCDTVAAECKVLRSDTTILRHRRMNVFEDPAEIKRLRGLGMVPGGVLTQQLPIPADLVASVGSSSSDRKAWRVLSAVYWTNPTLRREFASSSTGLNGLLRWAVVTGRHLSSQEILGAQWLPPVGPSFFLSPYLSAYTEWANVLQGHRHASSASIQARGAGNLVTAREPTRQFRVVECARSGRSIAWAITPSRKCAYPIATCS